MRFALEIRVLILTKPRAQIRTLILEGHRDTMQRPNNFSCLLELLVQRQSAIESLIKEYCSIRDQMKPTVLAYLRQK